MNKILIGIFTAATVGFCHADEFKDFKKAIVEESRDMAAFENPEFEDVSKYGTVNENVEIGRFGFNGNGGMRLRPLNKKLSWALPFKGRLEKGRRYIFSADVRRHGSVSFQAACDVYYRSPRKYAFGAWGPKQTPLDDGWVRQEVEFIAKDEPDNLAYKFMVYSFVPNNADVTDRNNYIDVDNISVRLAAPKWYFSNTWPTHNRIHKEEGRVRCSSSFWGEYLAKNAEAVYAFSVIAGDGKVLAKCKAKADKRGVMTADFGKIDYEGPVTLSVTLYDTRNRLNLGGRSLALSLVKKPDESRGLFVRENGVVLKDGKPFMPLGFYANLADYRKYTPEQLEFELKRIADAGFNAIIDYQTYMLAKGEMRDRYYGLCAKYGISVLADDFKVTDLKTVDALMPKFRERARDLVRYPALIGFYTMDEGSESFVPPLTKIRRMLNEVAPSHMVNICNIMRAAPYLPIADIQGGDHYPVNIKGLGLMNCHNRVKTMNDCAPAAIWWAPQAYNWASMVRGALNDAELYRKSGREPTENEMFAVAILNASDGVTGFFFYSHFDIFRCPIKEWIPLRWQRACNVGRIIKDMEPFIMSGVPVVELPHQDQKDPVRVVAFTDGAGRKRVAVIGLGREHETRFSLPASFGKLKGIYGLVEEKNGEYLFKAKEYSADLLK